MGNGFGINGISSTDINALYSDPYFQQALASYNANSLNFRGASSQVSPQISAAQTPQVAPQINYATAQPDESHTGLWVTGVLGAAALFGLGCKGKGNPIKGAKKLFNEIFKSGKDKATSELSQKLTNMRVVRRGNKVEYYVPGEKQTVTSDVETFIANHGIDRKVLLNLSEGESKVLEGSFTSKKGHTILFKDGKLSEIIDTSGNNILNDAFKKKFNKYIEELNERITGITNRESGWAKNINSIVVRHEVGDNVAELLYKNGGKGAEIRKLTTLKPITDKNDKAIKSYLYAHPEEKDAIMAKDLLKKGHKVPEGMGIGEVKIAKDGVTYHFDKDGEVIGITKTVKDKDGKDVIRYFKKGQEEYNLTMADNETMIKRVYDVKINGENKASFLGDSEFKKYIKGVKDEDVVASYSAAA